jgi:hypothetical protein
MSSYQERQNKYTQERNLIINAFTPSAVVPADLPKIPKGYDIPTFPRRSKKLNTDLILNPITDKYVDNNWDNRKRIINRIKEENKKRDTVINLRNSITRQNDLSNKISGITNRMDIFSNFGKLTISTQGINTLEEFFNVIQYSISKGVSKMGGKWVASSVQLYWLAENNKVIIRSIKAGYFGKNANFQQFEKKIQLLEEGAVDVAGSEAIDTNELQLSFKSFGVFLKKLPGTEATKNIFEVVGVKSDGKCFTTALEQLELLPPGLEFYGNYDSFIKFLSDNKIKVRVISNILNTIDMESIEDGDMYEIKIKGSRHSDLVYRLKSSNHHEKYTYNTLYPPNGVSYEHTLLYCPFDNHIDIIPNNKPVICDDIFISTAGDIYKGSLDEMVKIYSISNIYKNTTVPKEIMTEMYVFYDYETIVDWSDSNIMIPYSLSWFWLTHEQVVSLSTSEDFYKDLDYILKKFKRCYNYITFDCSDIFIKWILDNQQHHIMRFVSYNGANFDNIILLRSLLETKQKHRERKDDIVIQDIQYNNNQLLNFKLNGRHTFFDLRRHLLGSLKNNCESFKLPKEYSKLDMNHNYIQHTYNKFLDESVNTDNIGQRLQARIKFIDEIKRMEELQKYNDNDVISLAILFTKYYATISNVEGFEFLKDNFTNYNTIGKVVATKFKKHVENKKINLPKLDIIQYQDMQKYKIAGRCEMFNGKIHTKDPVCSLDICSMYPFVMTILNCYYPCGEIKTAKKYYKSTEKLGFWYCDVDQSSLRERNLPNIYAEKTGDENDWGTHNILEKYLLSNITIDLLLKYKVKIKIYNEIDLLDDEGQKIGNKRSFYFTKKERSIDMFGFLAELMKAKNEQDTYKKNKDTSYNPALREVLKLAMNSLSGKVIQGLFLDKIGVLDNLQQYEKIAEKYDTNIINNIGDKLFVSYKIDITDAINRQSPIYLGCFIYEYARSYMYEVLLSKVGLDKCIYQDTDCLKFRVSDMNNWINTYGNQSVPHWEDAGKYDSRYNDNHPLYHPETKVFGSFENELKDNNLFILLQKKMWLVAKTDGDRVSYIKTRFKGINPKSLLLDTNEPFIERIDKGYITNADGKREKVKDINTATYVETEYRVKYDKKNPDYDIDKKIFDWVYTDGKPKEIGSDYDKDEGEILNQIKFFEKVFHNGHAYVLCNNLRRVVKNTNRSVQNGEEDKYNYYNNTIQLIYVVKKITV